MRTSPQAAAQAPPLHRRDVADAEAGLQPKLHPLRETLGPESFAFGWLSSPCRPALVHLRQAQRQLRTRNPTGTRWRQGAQSGGRRRRPAQEALAQATSPADNPLAPDAHCPRTRAVARGGASTSHVACCTCAAAAAAAASSRGRDEAERRSRCAPSAPLAPLAPAKHPRGLLRDSASPPKAAPGPGPGPPSAAAPACLQAKSLWAVKFFSHHFPHIRCPCPCSLVL